MLNNEENLLNDEEEDVVIAVSNNIVNFINLKNFCSQLDLFIISKEISLNIIVYLFQGSELDEALSKMGYTDYEIVPLINDKPLTDKADDKPALKVSEFCIFTILISFSFFKPRIF